ncbi:MAG: PCRF domain-containing protein, partial [Candidatus Portiera sp.]|nr:PCRF domain-containing protein [Portiera sp.]
MQDRQRQYMEKIKSRSDELNQLLSSPDIVNNVDLLRNYSKEASNIREIATLFDGYLKIEEEIEETSVLLKDADHEVRDMASAEMNKLKEQLAQKLENIQESILGKESADNRNVYILLVLVLVSLVLLLVAAELD